MSDQHVMLPHGEPMVAEQTRVLIDEARAQVDLHLSAELSRLKARWAVNPAIRDDEL